MDKHAALKTRILLAILAAVAQMSHAANATGGTITTNGGYRGHTFTNSGTFAVTEAGNMDLPGSQPAGDVPSPAWATTTGTDEYGNWADLKVGDVTQRFRWIKPGKFLMGSPETETGSHYRPGHSPDEAQHEVTLTKGYWMADCVITIGFYKAVMGKSPGGHGEDNWPAPYQNWDGLHECIDKFNSRVKGGNFRLPTEAEWEYACRAGTTDVRYGNLDDIAWYKPNAGNTQHPVKSKQANAWGLCDMIGEAWQWVSDWYAPYPTTPQTDPIGPVTGEKGILRGAHSWSSFPEDCRAATRTPLMKDPKSADGVVCFRLAASATPSGGTPVPHGLARGSNGLIGVSIPRMDGTDGEFRTKMFVDVVKGRRVWQNAKDRTVDKNGWPTPTKDTLVTVGIFELRPHGGWTPAMANEPDGYKPDWSGIYNCSFQGKAEVHMHEGPGAKVFDLKYHSVSNTTTFKVDFPRDLGLLAFDFYTQRNGAASAGSGFSNLHVIRPEYPADSKETFTRSFLKSLAPFSVLRVTELNSGARWGREGDDYTVPLEWAKRRLTTDSTQQSIDGKFGIAWEYIVELANTTHKDIWINIPLNASDRGGPHSLDHEMQKLS